MLIFIKGGIVAKIQIYVERLRGEVHAFKAEVIVGTRVLRGTGKNAIEAVDALFLELFRAGLSTNHNDYTIKYQ